MDGEMLFSRSPNAPAPVKSCRRLLAARIGAPELMILLSMDPKLWFGLAALLASFLAGCSTVESRIKSNPQIYASLLPADQALIRQGQIREGMPKAAVFLAWGNPDRMRSGIRLGHPFEAWVYTTARSTVLADYYYYPSFYRFGYFRGGVW